jgi:hypothetical protein
MGHIRGDGLTLVAMGEEEHEMGQVVLHELEVVHFDVGVRNHSYCSENI